MEVSLNFGNLSDEEFEKHLNGDTRAEMEGQSAKEKIAMHERKVAKLKSEQKYGHRAEDIHLAESLNLSQKVMSLSDADAEKILYAVNHTDAGMPVFHPYNSKEALAEALKPQYRDEFSTEKQHRLEGALAALKGAKKAKARKSAMDLNDEEFERALTAKNRRHSSRSNDEGNWLQQYSESQRHKMNSDFMNY